MPLEGNDQEHNSSDAAQQVTTDQGSEATYSLPPVGGSPDPPPPPPGENHPKQGGDEWRKNTKMGLEIFGVLLLFAYTWFSCLQWLQIRYTNQLTTRALDTSDSSLRKTLNKMQGQIDVANNANEIAKTQFQKDQRPYLATSTNVPIDSPKFVGDPGIPNHGQIIWDWHVTNFGKTPAYDITFTERIKLAGELSFHPTYGEKSAHHIGAAAPTGSFFSAAISDPMTPEKFNELWAKEQGISIHVIIKYRDAAGTWYETSICNSRLVSGAIELCEPSYIK